MERRRGGERSERGRKRRRRRKDSAHIQKFTTVLGGL
jgi:hypothetical protein